MASIAVRPLDYRVGIPSLRNSPARRLQVCRQGCAARQGRGADGVGAVGALAIPGRTFPVRDLYLEDALEATGFAIGRASRRAALAAAPACSCAGPSACRRGSAQPAVCPQPGARQRWL
jgi:hypothetical protein